MTYRTKGMRFPARPLSREEIISLVSSFGPGFCGRRNAALVMLIWRSGLRIAEALALTSEDIDIDRGCVTVNHGKGNKLRVVGFDDSVIVSLGEWLETRGNWFNGDTPNLLFCTTRGDAIDPSYIRHMLKRKGKQAGIEGRVHAHGLRHSHAFELHKEGVPLVHIADQLGHSNISTTNQYLRHLDPSERIGRIRNRNL